MPKEIPVPDPEQPVPPERNEKLRNVLIVAAAYVVSALFYKGLFREGFGHSSLLFIGLPGVLACLLALAPRAGTAKGGIVKGITFALLLIAPLVGEGYLCILMASPLFYATGLAIGATIDASRNKTTTLSCTTVVVLVLSLDGIAPSHPREEMVSVTRVVAASAQDVRKALAQSPDIQTPLPRFLRIGFPRPTAVSGTGLAVGATRIIRFSGAEGDPPGDLTLRVAHASDSDVLFVATGDTSKLTQWVVWKSSLVEFQPVDATHTRITWQTTFDRQLDPWWYFSPWERYAVRKATEYLLAANATPSALRPGEQH
jgi:hypothetical protein